MRFVLHGRSQWACFGQVEAVSGVTPEPVRKFGVRVNELIYPVKQALAVVLGFPAVTSRAGQRAGITAVWL